MEEPKQNPKNQGFPTTHWSVINALKSADDQDRPTLFAEFVERYTPAFRAHLVSFRGYRNEPDIEDTIQGFISDKFVFNNILEHVQEEKGRLRSYLRKCLDNYVKGLHRSKTSAAWSNRISFDDYEMHSMELEQSDKICPFDLGWADSVMTEAIIRTKDQYFHGQRNDIWDVFDLCIVRPLFTGVPAVPYDQLAEQLDLSVKEVQNKRVSGIRAFGKHLTAVIAEYVGNDPTKIDDEIAELYRIMQSDCFRDYSS